MGPLTLPPAIWDFIWVLAVSGVVGLLIALYAVVTGLHLIGKAADAIAYWLKDWRLWRDRNRTRWPADKLARLRLSRKPR